MESKATSGKEAQRHNILAAIALGETVRTTLGPRGMDKMVVAKDGNIIVTNDGAAILGAMELPHPTARMIAEAARTQEQEVGDGTTTVVVLAAELLKQAGELLEKGMHPTVIIKGYKLAFDRAIKLLHETAKTVKNPSKVMKDIAVTAMTGKGVEEQRDMLAELAVKTADLVLVNRTLRRDNIKIVAKPGGNISDSVLIKGLILEKGRLKEGMPPRIEHPKIALISSSIEIKETEIDSKITINSPEQMEKFVEMEESLLNQMVNKIIASGANAVFCEKGIDDIAQHKLEKAGVFALRRVRHKDMRLLAKATGARIVSQPSELNPKELGRADLIEERIIGDEILTFIMGCPITGAVTVLLRGGTAQVIDEVQRALYDAIGDIGAAMETAKVLGGAGAAEMELARGLERFSDSLPGKEQLPVRAFARAMEIIPATLAENSGLEAIEVLARLRASHDNGESYIGFDVSTGRIVNTLKEGIIEPLKIKTQALSSALEVATMILRIDDIIVNKDTENYLYTDSRQ